MVERALKFSNKLVKNPFNKGIILLSQKKFEEARCQFEFALSNTKPALPIGKSNFLFEYYKRKASCAFYRVQSKEKALIFYMIGLCILKFNEQYSPDKRLPEKKHASVSTWHFEQAVKYDKKNTDYLSKLAEVYFSNGRFYDAYKLYEQLFTLTKDSKWIKEKLFCSGILDLEIDLKKINILNICKFLWDSGNEYFNEKKYYVAIQFFKYALKIHGDNDKLQFNIAHCYLLLGENYFKDAISHFKKAIEINPNLGKYHHHLALAYYLDGKYNDALSSIETSISCGYDNCFVPFDYGKILIELKNYSGAIIKLKKAIELFNYDTVVEPDLYRYLANAYFNNGQYLLALDNYKLFFEKSDFDKYVIIVNILMESCVKNNNLIKNITQLADNMVSYSLGYEANGLKSCMNSLASQIIKDSIQFGYLTPEDLNNNLDAFLEIMEKTTFFLAIGKKNEIYVESGVF